MSRLSQEGRASVTGVKTWSQKFSLLYLLLMALMATGFIQDFSHQEYVCFLVGVTTEKFQDVLICNYCYSLI